jgi:hypothetical protein
VESRVLRRIFGPKRDRISGDWKKSCNEFLVLFSLPDITCVMNSRKMKWVGHEGEQKYIQYFDGKNLMK